MQKVITTGDLIEGMSYGEYISPSRQNLCTRRRFVMKRAALFCALLAFKIERTTDLYAKEISKK